MKEYRIRLDDITVMSHFVLYCRKFNFADNEHFPSRSRYNFIYVCGNMLNVEGRKIFQIKYGKYDTV